jgi:biopolymer transport protein ExbD
MKLSTSFFDVLLLLMMMILLVARNPSLASQLLVDVMRGNTSGVAVQKDDAILRVAGPGILFLDGRAETLASVVGQDWSVRTLSVRADRDVPFVVVGEVLRELVQAGVPVELDVTKEKLE